MPTIDNSSVTSDQESDPLTTSGYEDSGEDLVLTPEAEEIEGSAEALVFLLGLHLEPQKPTQTTMSNQPQAPPPVTVAATVKPAELQLGQPSAFDGETAKARTWLNTVQTYLHVNNDVYNTEERW